MELRDHLNQCYFDMTVSDIRLLHHKVGADLSYNTIMYLDIISFQETCTVSSLAQILQISKSAVTLKVNELVKQKLVIKKQSESDKRVYYLHVSPEVEESLKDYDRPFEKAVQRVEKEYSSEQVKIFCDILQTFSEEFRKEEFYG